MGDSKRRRDIPGTTVFDGDQARKGYALNKMCYSFNSAENRAEFLRDEGGGAVARFPALLHRRVFVETAAADAE